MTGLLFQPLRSVIFALVLIAKGGLPVGVVLTRSFYSTLGSIIAVLGG
jgi:hypothetical protein